MLPGLEYLFTGEAASHTAHSQLKTSSEKSTSTFHFRQEMLEPGKGKCTQRYFLEQTKINIPFFFTNLLKFFFKVLFGIK